MPDFAEQLVMSEPVESEAPAPAVQPASAPVSDDRPRDEHGRFAPKAKDEGIEKGVKQEAAPPQPAAQPQPEPPSGDEGKHVPLAALTALKQKLAEREAELAKFTQQQPPAQAQQTPPQPQNPSQSETPKRPDFSFDTSVFEDDPQALFDARLHRSKMEMSTLMASQMFGDDAVNEAWAAFDKATADPTVAALSVSLRDHPHPMGEVVKWHRQRKEINQLSEAGGLEKLREQIRAQLMAEIQGQQPSAAPVSIGAPTAVPMPTASAPALPPSLAKGGSGHGAAPERPTDNDVFENIFDKSKRLSRKSR